MFVFRLLLFSLFILVVPVYSVSAQNIPAQCYEQYEVIFPLREPVFDRPSLWRYTKREAGFDSLIDTDIGAKGNIISAGEIISSDNSEDLNILFMKVTQDGKVDILKEDKRAGSQSVSSIITRDKDVLIAGNQLKNGVSKVRISYYDYEGNFLREEFIYDSKYNLYLSKIIPVNDSKNSDMIMLVWAENKKIPEDNYTRIYRVSSKGNVIWRRSFISGAPNRLDEIIPIENGQYLAAGYLIIDSKRKVGWLVKIGSLGEIIWEQNYPRGKEALFKAASEYKNDGSYVVTGSTIPYGNNDKRAGFVIKISKTGETIWQRYYTGNYRYSGYDVKAHDDGRAEIIIDANPLEDWGKGFTRILTLSPNGYLLDDESYEEGNDATIFNMVTDKEGKRFLAGNTQNGYSKNMIEKGKKQKEFLDLWIMAIPALPNYNNPCVTKRYGNMND